MNKLAVFLVAIFMFSSMAQADWDRILSNQTLDVWADGWWAFESMDLTTFHLDVYSEHFGSDAADYDLKVYKHWIGLYLYDFDYGSFCDYIWLYMQTT